MFRLGSGVLAVALVATVALGGDADKDRKLLQGKWEGMIPGEPEEYELTIDKDRWTLQDKNKKELFFKGTFTIDPKGKPATMDMKVEEGGAMLEKFKGKTALAVYELGGDVLKWCANEPGKEGRPTEFSNKGDQIFVEFKRAK